MNQIQPRQTAGQLSQKIAKDTSKYDAMEVGYYMAEDLIEHFRESARIYKNMIDEKEFCCVMVIAEDPLIKRLKRRKFYCWPYLPSPRPNQAVFLYNKEKDMFTKRLWVLPSAMVMAELAGTNVIVDKRYETQQAWSIAFYKGMVLICYQNKNIYHPIAKNCSRRDVRSLMAISLSSSTSVKSALIKS
jgi:hypothetical protein